MLIHSSLALRLSDFYGRLNGNRTTKNGCKWDMMVLLKLGKLWKCGFYFTSYWFFHNMDLFGFKWKILENWLLGFPKKTDGSIEVLFGVGNCISENGMKIHDHQGQGLELEVIQSISQLQVSWWRFTFFPGLMPLAIGVFHKWKYPNSWMVYFMENPTINGWELRVPRFQETSHPG